MNHQQEKRNQRTALLISIGTHAVIFFLLLFIVAWRAPNPPLPEYGIELNFGTDDQGSGDVQPETPVGTDNPQNEAEGAPEKSEPTETQEVVEETKPTETNPAEQQVSSKVESPVVLKEVKKEAVKSEETKPKEELKKQDPKAAYNPSTTKTTGTKETGTKEGKPGNEGDDTGKTGDKGDIKGADPKGGYSGQQGGGDGGPKLDLKGWDWDKIPIPNVPNNETGQVVFEIEVDDNGELIKYRKESGSVSPAAERACREAIEKISFIKKSGAKVPKSSTGKITFVIRAQ